MYRRILVSVDGSTTSTKALTEAIRMAGYAGGRCELRLIHVVDEMAYFTGYDPYAAQSGDLIRVMREAGQKILADALAIALSAGVTADTLLIDRFGERLGETVAEEATRWKADLLVVGTHGRRRVGRMFLGSGAEQIIRLAPVPVLVVRNPEGDQDDAA
jgi:nucleotide-binding universal stress UspA family protein